MEENVYSSDMTKKLASLPIFSNLEYMELCGFQTANFDRDAFKLFINVSIPVFS